MIRRRNPSSPFRKVASMWIGAAVVVGLAAGALAPPAAAKAPPRKKKVATQPTAKKVATQPPATTVAPPSGQMAMAPGEAEITYFRRAGDEHLMRMSVSGSTSSSSGPPTIVVDAGDAVLFQWGFRTRHAINASAVINYGSHSITLNPGTPETKADGWTEYSNQRNVTITEPGLYTFRVTVMPGGHREEKSIQVNVHSATLATQRPDVNPTTRRVTFSVRNNGDADAEGRFTVNYQIQGRDPMRSLVESSLTTGSLTLAPHDEMELGHVDLPESAWQSAQLWMRVNIGLSGRAPVASSSHDYTYSWPTHELHISSSQISSVGVLLGGEVRVHNYSNPSSDSVTSRPYVENGSYINLMGENIPFTFPYIIFEIAALEHYFFVNNFRADLGGDSFLNIEGGKLVMRANFDCGRSEREAKGWTRDWVLKRYVDNTTPDIDIQRFNLTISLTPTLVGNKISYRDPSLAVDSAMRFPGGWAWLNGFKDRMNSEVQSSVRTSFTTMLSRGSIKSQIENSLTDTVMALGAAMGIHDLVSIRGSGSEIIVTYR